MSHGRRVLVAAALVTAAVLLGGAIGEAHKPITSPFTFSEDVYPILRDRCSRCHVAGGVAPMSLMTHEDTVPWSESIRIELMAGHMPPWSVDGAPERFPRSQSLTARELNVLMTWASGGTPIGSADFASVPVEPPGTWRLGVPELVMPLPEFAMGVETQEETAEFTLPVGNRAPRWLRAVDFQPGTAAIVRSATITVRSGPNSAATDEPGFERVVAMWVPGDEPVALENGVGFPVPPGGELVVRVRYKKTWEYERKAMTDRSSVGLYFAQGLATPVRALAMAAPLNGSSAFDSNGSPSSEYVLREDVLVLAIYPDTAQVSVSADLEALRPDGYEDQLISLRAQKGWARRYWLSEPVLLPRGTKLNARAMLDSVNQAIPNGAPPDPAGPSTLRLVLNVIPASR